MDGFQVLRKIRNRKKNLPVLVLTGRTRVEDRVKGLDLGADDYMVKPFAFLELTARVRALLRRGDGHVDFKLRVDDLEMNLVERTVDRSERRIELTPKEFGLLEYLMRNQGRAVSRPMIIEHVWNFSFDTMTNVVDVYINYLRKKVDGGEAQKLIHTVRGVGYRIGNSQ
jgi:two-component system copper resistance phosphate regulon response regulator CusR